MLINHRSSNLLVSAKSLETQNVASCQHSVDFFKSFLNVTIQSSNKVGDVCGGHCCDNRTETDVLKKSVKMFEGLIKHQLKSLKGLWESTYSIYKDHVLELSRQSENKTLTLFSTVYRRMSPLSRSPILELYKSIRSHISSQKSLHEEELEAVIEKFFRNLFPLAYHHAVHSRDADEESMARDFHVDYKNCLEKSYDVLQPFGDIPQSISRMLVQSVGSANVLLRSLDNGVKIVGETESLPIDTLSVKCQHALLKMNYCASCKGHNYHHSKPCYGYCSNVVRGCLTQFLGGMDTDWTSFSEAIERLMTLVRNKDGIESVIKNLDGKLSEAIMHAMTNGPELEKKVHKSCGAPSIRHNDKIPSYDSSSEDTVDGPSLEKKQKQVPPVHHGNKWAPPPDTEMLLFLTNLDRSKTFSLQIASSLCEDDRYQKQDKDCWTGDHLGDYTHKVMDMHSQKYNPEVPTLQVVNNERLHQLNDQLITLKNMVNKQMTHLSRSDSDKMLGDMAEGSADEYEDRYEDGGYDDEMSGDGSGDGMSYNREVPVVEPGSPDDGHSRIDLGITPVAGSSCRISIASLTLVLTSLIVIFVKLL